MDILKIINITLFIAYLIFILFGIVTLSFLFFQKNKARRLLRESIIKKMALGIQLTAEDVVKMAKGIGLPRANVYRTICQLLNENHDPQLFQQLKVLSGDLDKEEPFSDLPEEVKPSLIRLTELCNGSQQNSDQFLLAPIQKALGSFVDLKADTEKTKKQNKWMNTIAIISFIIGLWGFYLTWKSPDSKDIANAVIQALTTQTNNAQNTASRIGVPQAPVR